MIPKRKPVEAGDGSYAGMVLEAFDKLPAPGPARKTTRTEPDYAADMKLPDGKTCHDCVHYNRCAALFGRSDESLCGSCDWWPSRYRERSPAASAATT